MGVYSSAKFAVEALSDALRIELADFGVSVVLIEPAWVATKLAAASAEQMAGPPLDIDGYEDQLSKSGAYITDQIQHHSIPPEKVARQLADAAETWRPRPRYVLPAKGRFLVQTHGSAAGWRG